MGIEKRVLVDMSATLIHHGHIRLLKNAKNYGKVIIALTTDEEISQNKLVIMPRTKGISSTKLREKAFKIFMQNQ